MKRCLIGLGGIGCSVVNEYCKKYGAEKTFCIFVDVDRAVLDLYDNKSNKIFLIPGYPKSGVGMYREMGKDYFHRAIYAYNLTDFFNDKFFSDDEIIVNFITTTFGGFGSAVVFEFAEFVISRLQSYWGSERFKVRITAFTHENYKDLFPKAIYDLYEMNTYQTVKESRYYQLRNSKVFPAFTFFPIFVRKLSDYGAVGEFCNLLETDDDELKRYCSKHSFELKAERKDNKPVFISYSSKDEKTAKKLADALEQKGIHCWFAPGSIRMGSYPKQIINGIRNAEIFIVLITRNSMSSQHVMNELDRAFNRLSEGLVLIPFILEDCEISDDFEYYICRQEYLWGNKPPLQARINSVVDKVQELLFPDNQDNSK